MTRKRPHLLERSMVIVCVCTVVAVTLSGCGGTSEGSGAAAWIEAETTAVLGDRPANRLDFAHEGGLESCPLADPAEAARILEPLGASDLDLSGVSVDWEPRTPDTTQRAVIACVFGRGVIIGAETPVDATTRDHVESQDLSTIDVEVDGVSGDAWVIEDGDGPLSITVAHDGFTLRVSVNSSFRDERPDLDRAALADALADLSAAMDARAQR